MQKITYIAIFILLVSCLETETREENKEQTIPILPESTDYQAKSLLGKELKERKLSRSVLNKRTRQLEAAKAKFDKNQESLESIVWYGRRLGYLYKFKKAIEIFSEGLKKYPNSYRLLRHRGHRYITLREFDKAIKDLEEAAFHMRGLPLIIEKDGLPNRKNIPISNIQFNIWYHLGLAYYLSGDYDKAISSYKKCMEVSNNDDLLVATTSWLYMTYRKIGNVEAAEEILEPIKRKLRLIENYDYYKKLQMYMGRVEPGNLVDLSATGKTINNPTIGYGVGNYFLYNGDAELAEEIFERVLQNARWDSFGYMAAEADLLSINSL